ncbi:MAG: copper resistance protein CopC [Microbacteriaceae bacterium]
MRKLLKFVTITVWSAGILFLAGPAHAHNAVLSTVPADGSTVGAQTDIVITTNDELLDLGSEGGGFAVVVSDSEGAYYGDGCVTVEGTSVTASPVLGAESSTYFVQYQLVSRDGHTITGEFSFDWAPDASAAAGPAFALIPECGVAQEPIGAGEPSATPTEAPSPGTPGPENNFGEPSITPIVIGVITIPVIIGAIVLLMRSLGSRTSEDHLN